MKKFTFILFLGLLILGFSACTDDNNNNSSESAIVGTWVLKEMDYTAKATTTGAGVNMVTNTTGELESGSPKVTFKSDNTFGSLGSYQIKTKTTTSYSPTPVESVQNFDDFHGSGTWSKNGNTLVLTNNSQGGAQNAQILSLTDSKMKLYLEETKVVNQGGMTVTTLIKGTQYLEKE